MYYIQQWDSLKNDWTICEYYPMDLAIAEDYFNDYIELAKQTKEVFRLIKIELIKQTDGN